VRQALVKPSGGVGVPTLAAALPLDLALERAPVAATAGGFALAGIFVAVVALPLATYTTALALFGLAHVGSELRYVDFRFRSRLPGGLMAWVLTALAAAVLVRLAGMTGVLSTTTDVVLELAFGAAMAVAVVAGMRQRRLLGASAALTLMAGAVVAPFQTFLCLTIVHNFTPVAFLADALEGATRRRALALLSVPFLILPLLIASGLPYELLARIGMVDPEATLFDGGSLVANMGVYVPVSLLDTPWALHMFSAAVFAQCMHYAAVIILLPRLIDAGRRQTLLPWPNARRFAVYLAIAGLAFAVGFMIDFKLARQVYALAALVHAWVEIPILLLLLDRGGRGTVTPA
jgi:hypothetical protein